MIFFRILLSRFLKTGIATCFALLCLIPQSKSLNAEPFLIFGNTVDIRRVNLDGTGYDYVVRGLTNVVGLDFDIKTQMIYWSDVGVKKIQRVHINDGLDPMKIEDIIAEDLGIPEDVAVDWTGRKLFWTDANKKIISVVNLDGTQRKALIATGHDKPRAIVLDPADDKVYWTDWGNEPKVVRAKMSDGTHKEVLVNSGIVWPNGLTLDYADKMLYWADANTDKIEKSQLDGQHRRVLIDRTRVYHPYALTQFGDRLYWSDWHQHSIEHCKKDTGNDRVSITGGLTRPTALHVYHPDRQPGADFNECEINNGECSHTCLDLIGGYKCICPAGFELKSDGKTCEDINECSYNRGGCEQLCINSPGNYTCSCLTGYTLQSDGKACQDADECRINHGGCEFSCNNTASSYYCSCRSGYLLAADKHSCLDIDECQTLTHQCPDLCENTPGSYKCSCSSGVTYNPVNKTCDDVNECLTNQNSCKQRCINTRGSFYCDCNPGFLLSSDHVTCSDVDECSQSNHSCQHQCINTFGSYVCGCDAGYTLSADGRTCDILDCGKPDGMAGISVKCDGTPDQYRFGKMCTLSCTKGFLIGSSLITCQASGQWSVITGQCVSQLPGSNSPPLGILLSSRFIPENSPVHAVVGRLTTVDNDEKQFFTYTLIDGAGVFTVDNNAGTLVLTGDVDYERQSVYMVSLMSTDSGVPQLSVQQNLTVHITDVNEPPSAPTLSSSFVFENASIGAVIGVVNSSDVDSGQEISYSLLTNAGDRFRLLRNELRLHSELNYEHTDSFIVTVEAKDSGSPRLVSVSVFNITVIDCNDPPTKLLFTGNSIPEFNERTPGGTQNGSVVGNFSTVDEDLWQSHIYKIVSPSSPFSINGSTLVVAWVDELNYETRDLVTLKVSSTDPFGESVISSIQIRLLDVNENPSGILLSADSFLEHAPLGTVVGSLSARDPDLHDNHTFDLVTNPNSVFSVEEKTLKIAVDIDFETAIVNPLSVLVKTTDGAGLSFEQTLNIVVLDKNEPPTDIVFHPRKPCVSSAGICVEENLKIGYRIGDITVIDPDRGDTVTCDIFSDSVFRIENGAVLVKGDINFEALDSSHLIGVEIRCRDRGGLAIEKSYNISVLDANDAPSSVSLSHHIVSSNASIGSLVGSFIVVDEDQSDSHRCYLLDPDSLFRVSGIQLFVRKPLTNATSSRQPIHVFCSDATDISFPTTLFIEVRNNHLSRQINISLASTKVKENEPAGTVVGRVTAKALDPSDSLVFQLDDDANGTFALVSGTSVNSRDLVTTRPLDYETESGYDVIIRVYGSGGATNFKVFHIQLIDVYEGPEHLVLHHNSVAENRLVGTLVGVITVKDPQLSPLSVKLLDDLRSAFELRSTSAPYTWKLMTRHPLDFETAQFHQVTLQAKDVNNSFAVNQSFTIYVTNVNEAPSLITLSNRAIAENSPHGTVVGIINVTDPDEAFVPQKITCGLRNDADGRFKVSGMALTVLESRMLNFEAPDGPDHLVDIECQDQDGDATQQQFIIAVTDVDEPPVRIESSSGKFEVAENLNPGSLVSVLRTLDEDRGQNYTYCVTPVELFSNVHDRLETRQRFNYEEQNVFFVNITSTDSGNQSLTTEVVVSVLDVNDAPTGIVLPQGTAIAENTKVGSLIGELSTLDEDRGQTHTYLIQAQTPSGVLSLGGSNKLYVADSSALNYELHRHVNITITTTDNGIHSRLSKVVTLSLAIVDVNEPPYDIQLFPASVKENSPIGTEVGTVTVQDPDIFPQRFQCRLREDASGRFGVKMNVSRIVLFLTGNGLEVNYEKHTWHNITLLCSDSGGLSYEKAFVIQVLDANDPPSNVIFTNSPGDTILSPNPPVNVSDIKLVSQAIATVNETAHVGITIVAYVRVVDEDNTNSPLRPQTHTCELVSEAEAKLFVTVDVHEPPKKRRKRSSDRNSVPSEFMIQPGTNSLLVRERLDYETRANYSLFVKCSDDGVPKMSTVNPLVVFVIDVPEAPTDILFSSLTIPENASNGDVVCNFTVVDADFTRTGYLYELTSHGIPFRLIGNHIVVSRVPLDHEATPLITVQLTTVEIFTDLKFVKMFDITITDVNEPPSSVTLDGKTEVSVLESSGIGNALGRFVVKDQDVNDTSFSITIEGEQNEIIGDFEVRGQDLVVASQLNAWSRDQYLLKVRATDRGGLSAVNIITITVEEVDLCALNKSYCSPYAICSRAGPGRASCACKLGFSGDGFRCSDINYCDPDPCHSGNTIGDCRDGFGGWKNYSCDCRPGWSPPKCDVKINECRPDPCSVDGTQNCEDLVNDFQCDCKPGYSGRLCETNINDCESASCLHGGTCVDKVNGYICLCKDPFIGVNCDTDDSICRENPNICLHNGTCISYAEDPSKFSCRCEEPWGGNCSGCAPGYSGQNCTPCVYPRTGENCDLNWENCKPNPCFHGGTWYPLRGEDFACVCPPKYSGKTCQEVIVVNADPGEGGKLTRLSRAGLFSLIGCVVFLCVIIVVIIIVWRRKKRRKYRSNSARVEYPNRRQKPEVSSTFREMMQQSKNTFENPAYIADPEFDAAMETAVDGPLNVDLVSRVTEIRLSGNAVAFARDNPMYEPAEEVLRKNKAVVCNPLFEDDSEAENVNSRNLRLWRRPEQLTFSKC
ncbi:protocadherin Fat 4-like [Stylophora pistillata]|uniref:protocadherin Fat 4-like n=1 Tax=Stylophora pistillata TaxID=50429 RepID=UPI000C041F26|nr:protocadherin Fat 4-like [Stylophora pistillata]